MNYMNNTLKRPSYTTFNTFLEQSQGQVLSVGYKLVMYKSKIKKRLFILTRMFTLFNI